ncbi:TadE/TadG family type IV pilus assembly protein [Arthrobacter sp. UNC362MFTsu5.1]|jgi:Flp pilus assembly protein TadG|uniref:TadE/TadG family type IV pilus assembly protein n=1 Tax=Arthrobacter sp. UNC362MFTsu5.1 TaxID=1449044 RepID=UPI0004848F1C|nr:TadE/TadG family type IV pilus assembly protein [Arthrobacter sp. UNC362MFTsu5.1]
MSRASERGAVAVEFAILAPVLIMLLLGIVEFSRAYNAQASLSAAAREGVRVMAISNKVSDANKAARDTAVSLQPGLKDTNIVFKNLDTGTTSCAPGNRITVIISYNLSTMTGIAGPFAMTGKGAMLCGG